MSRAQRIYQGPFGRVALLDMDDPLVVHAHSQCHVLMKAGGEDTFFRVRNQLCPLRDDTAVLVNAWEPHCYAHRDEWPTTTILALYIEPRWLCSLDRLFASSAGPSFFGQSCVEISKQSGILTHRLVELMQDRKSPASAIEPTVYELMAVLIGEHSNWRELRQNPQIFGAVADSRVASVVNEMRQMLGGEFDIDHLAAVSGLSRPYFFEFFRTATNLSPALFFNLIRMEEAHRRLITTDQPLTALALDLSFQEHSHFTRFFREHQGICPLDYRRTVQTV